MHARRINERPAFVGYLYATAIIAGAIGFRLLLDPLLGPGAPFITLFLAVPLVGWMFGKGPGIYSLILGMVAADYFFLKPFWKFSVNSVENIFLLATFVLMSSGLLLVIESLKRAWQVADTGRVELQTTLHSIGDAVITTDSTGLVTSLNPVAESLTGWISSEAIGQSVNTIFVLQNESTRESFENPAERVLRLGSSVGQQNHTLLISKDGTARPIEHSTSLVQSPTHEIHGTVLVFRDVTSKREAERNLQLRAKMLDSIAQAVIVTDPTATIIYWNQFAESLYGWTSKEAIGRNARDLIVPFFDQSSASDIHKQIWSGSVWSGEFILKKKDGNTFPAQVLTSPVYDDNGVQTAAIGVSFSVADKKEAETALKLQADHLEDFFENATVGLHWVNSDGTILRANRAELELLGYSPEDYVGKQIADFHADKDNIADILRRLKNREILVEHPANLISKNGQIKNVLISSSVLWDENGNFIHTRCFTRDVTDEIATRNALYKSEERLRLALNAGKMGVWDWDIKSNKLEWTENLEPLHGLKPGEFDGTFEGFLKAVHPDDKERVVSDIKRAVDTGSEFATEFRVKMPNGLTTWIEGVGEVYTDPEGEPYRMVGIGMDISSRKRSEEIYKFLAEASKELSVLENVDETLKKVASLAVPHFADWVAVDMLSDGQLRRVAVAHIDPEKVQLANDLYDRFGAGDDKTSGAWKIVESGEPELVKEITDDMLAAADLDADLLAVIKELGLKSYIGVPIKRRKKTIGVITFISAEGDHLYDEVDLAVADDLATRAAIAFENSKLYQSLTEADERKDHFIATLAHELRNPLAPITSSLELLKRSGGSSEFFEFSTSTMERQVSQMTRLVDDLLDISRITRDKLELRKEHIDLRETLDHAFNSVKPQIEAKGQSLDVSIPEAEMTVDADPVRLDQVFGNLLANASKYSPSGSSIRVTASLVGSDAVVSVTDDGIGIPTEMLDHVFDMFVQIRSQSANANSGLGIGLSLVKRLVEMHGGSVVARSEGKGKGSEFIVTLPLVNTK